MKTLSATFKGILFIFIVGVSAVSVSVPALADDNLTTQPMLGEILPHDGDPAFNVAPTERTNETTVTVHLIGAEGSYDAVHLAEDVAFSSNTQSYWRPPLGSYDGGTTITFILSSGDTLKTIWAVLDSGGETFSTPPTSATLALDTTQPDVTSSTLQTQPNLRLHVTMEFSEAVHEFTADDIWLGGVALAVEEFGGEGTEYSFDVVAGGEGELTIGFFTDDVFDLAGNPVIEQASPLVEYYPFIPLETPGATESAALTGGLFGLLAPSLLSLEESGGGQSMLMGTMDPVWVDFDWQTPEEGTEESPFNTLQEGLENVVDSGTVIIKAGTSAETLTINQAVRLEASGGTARIGDPAAATTEYFPLPIGMPIDTPLDGVVGQALAASSAPQLDLEIESVKIIEGETVTTLPNNSFELQPMGNGNFNLVWKGSSGINLADYDRVEVSVNRIEGTQSAHHATWTQYLTQPDENTRWVFIVFASNVDNWRMKVGPHVLTATDQTGFAWWYAFDIDKSYTIGIKRTAILHSPSPVPYLGWEAFTFNLGTPVNGWQGSASGAWIHDPDNIVGTEILAQAKNPGGGKATMIVDDLSLTLSPNQPVQLSEGTERLFLTRTDSTADNTMTRRNLVLKWRGLDKLKAKGLTDAEIDLSLSQSSGSNAGRVRVFKKVTGGENRIMSEDQDSVSMDIEDFISAQTVELSVVGATAGSGALTVDLKGSADSESVHTDSVNYHVIEPFTISLAETARVYNEKRLAVTMEPDLEPPAGGSEEAWLNKRRLLIYRDCGGPNDGTTSIEMIENPPFAMPLLYAYDKLEDVETPNVATGFVLWPLFPTASTTLSYYSDVYFNKDPDHKVRLGFDTNGNSNLDGNETLVAFDLHLVTDDNYNSSKAQSGLMLDLLVDDLSLNLFTRFVTNSWDPSASAYNPNSTSVTQVRGSNNTISSSILPRLTHNFGETTFTGQWEDLEATVPLYIFDEGSAASDLIESDTLPGYNNQILTHIQNEITHEMIDDKYAGPGVESVTFVDQNIAISVGGIDQIFSVGTGKFNAFGSMTFDVEEISGGFAIRNIVVDLVARDLFDFNYFNTILFGPQAAASLQCGRGIPACENNVGNVFVTHIYMHKAVNGFVVIPQ
jgi:hypothetical protein